MRDLAASHGTDFQIWTGPFDILELDDTDGDPVQIYLGLTQNEEVIPAPMSVWKVVYKKKLLYNSNSKNFSSN